MINNNTGEEQENRELHINFMIDTNCINARQTNLYLNQIEKWKWNYVINVIMSRTAYSEANAGGNPDRSRKVALQIYSITHYDSQEEKEIKRKIENILFPNGVNNNNEKNDVEIVYNAKKYDCILITSDGNSKRQPGGILGNRSSLRSLGIRIMTANEAVDMVKNKINERDERARRISLETKRPLPHWVGLD